MESETEEPTPSTSNQVQNSENELDVDKELNKVLTVEEFLLKSKTYMLENEKYMFLDTIDSDCLVVGARFVQILSYECFNQNQLMFQYLSEGSAMNESF